MNNQELEQKNIIISAVEDVGWGIKIKCGEGSTYNVPKLKKNTQTETAAFQAIKSLQGYGMGMKKCFKFVTVDNSQGGQSKYVRIISDPVQEIPDMSPEPQYVEKPQETPNLAPQATQKPDWEKISWGKCKYGFLLEIFKKADNPNTLNLEAMEQEAEVWADMAMRKLDKQNVQTSEYPVAEDINIEGIPFN